MTRAMHRAGSDFLYAIGAVGTYALVPIGLGTLCGGVGFIVSGLFGGYLVAFTLGWFASETTLVTITTAAGVVGGVVSGLSGAALGEGAAHEVVEGAMQGEMVMNPVP